METSGLLRPGHPACDDGNRRIVLNPEEEIPEIPKNILTESSAFIDALQDSEIIDALPQIRSRAQFEISSRFIKNRWAISFAGDL